MFSKENAISATGLAGSLRPLRSYHPASAECSMSTIPVVSSSPKFCVVGSLLTVTSLNTGLTMSSPGRVLANCKFG